MADFFLIGGKPTAFFFNGGKATQAFLAGASLLTATFPITCEIQNGTYTGPGVIQEKETVEITIVPTAPYELAQILSVTGAEYTFDSATNTLTLSNPTEDVVVSARCKTKVWDGVTYAGTKWKFKPSASVASYNIPWSSFPYSSTNVAVSGTLYDTDGVTPLSGAYADGNYSRYSWNVTPYIGSPYTAYGGTWRIGYRSINNVLNIMGVQNYGSFSYTQLQNLYFKFSDNQGSLPAVYANTLKALATIVDW
ncbi:MAG: hypothetical protein IJU20_08070 [Clostridia bacterium]|nr:hypothetical protein [Clostridia bacterium]